MAANSPGWAVALHGAEADLNLFRHMLAAPFSPWVESFPDADNVGLALRSSTWATITDAARINADAQRMVEVLNGEALLFFDDAKPVTAGGVMSFRPDGKRDAFVFPVTGTMNITLGRIRAQAFGTAGPPQPPQESPMQRWLREADSDATGVRAEMFAHLTRADNWFDLYKAMELVRRVVGSEAKLKVLLAADSAPWERAWRTANCYRHAPNPQKYPLPQPPAELSDARIFLLGVVPRLI